MFHTLTALRNRFGLLTNDLINDGVDAMMNVLFPNMSRRSRSTTPILSRSSTPILPADFYFKSPDDFSYSPYSVEPRDSYKTELHKDGLNLPLEYYKNGSFPFTTRWAHDMPTSFSKHRRTMTSVQLSAHYTAHKVMDIY